jgi:hypothetical protein
MKSIKEGRPDEYQSRTPGDFLPFQLLLISPLILYLDEYKGII